VVAIGDDMEMPLRVAKEAKSPGAVSGEIDVKLWRWRDVVTFLLFLAGFTAVGSSLAIISKNLFGASGYYVRILMWSPAFAAVTTAAVAGRSLGDFGWHWGRWKWQIQAWLVPFLYVAIAYCLIWSLGLGGVPNHEFLAKAANQVSLPVSSGVAAALLIVFAGTIGLLNFSGALGEEIGWRGFVVPAFYQLTRGNFTATALMSGIVWAVWHAPIIFLSSYNNPGVSRLYSFSWFVLLILASATIDAWYRLRSGSLWTGVILHTSHNLYLQSIFTPLTSDTGRTQYFIDEFGAILPIIMLLFAIHFWAKRGELAAVQTN
jgi:membrane protease YdiL (CAAX protease family)